MSSRRGTRDTNQTARWVVEQTLALLHQFRHLTTRRERRTDIHHGLLTLTTSPHILAQTPKPHVLEALRSIRLTGSFKGLSYPSG